MVIEWRRWPAYERDRRTLAVHEAAHLVVGIATHTWREDRRAVVSDTSGCVEPVAPQPLPTRTLAEALAPVAEPIDPSLQRLALQHAATMLAGYAAEARLHGFAHEITGPPSAITGTPDDCMARVYLRFAWPDERIRPMWRAWRLADDLVSEHWGWICAVAAVIARHGACDTAQALRLQVSTPGTSPRQHRAA